MTDLLDYLTGGKRPQPTPTVGNYEPHEIDEAEVWQRAIAISERTLERAAVVPSITFDYGPVCIVNCADWHLGGDGTDYARLERELTLIRDTPGMYVAFVGDALDNFIIGKLMALRMGTSFKVSEEWAMVRHAFSMIADKIIYVVDGNHDQWTYRLAGIDYFGETMERIRPGVIYANDELTVDIAVGPSVTRFKVRHKWKGNSIYNPTHGIERASKFDKGKHFDIGVGAHTHESGLSREFNNGGTTGIAVLCGTYKREDGFAKQVGFSQFNEATAVATILDEDGIALGTNKLHKAANYMRALYE